MLKIFETKAPRNRTLFLTPEDYQRYTNLEVFPEGESIIPIAYASNKISHASCLSGMARLPEESVDLIFADPPYYGRDKDFGNGTVNLSLDDYIDWSEHWIKPAVRLLKKTGSRYVCCDQRFSEKLQINVTQILIFTFTKSGTPEKNYPGQYWTQAPKPVTLNLS